MRFYKGEHFISEVSCPLNACDELRNPKVLHYNRLPARSTSVPSGEKGIFYRNKEKSDRIFSLNGDYFFALFSDEAPENFENPEFDCSDWDLIDVPSMWQFRGYGDPAYPNTEYAFPFDPPNIDRLNPVGCYIKKFTVKNVSYRSILHFSGVDNAFYAYLNGEFVGFSKGSRIPAEFDISGKLKSGVNTLAVKVYTYSDASYLENQDMLLANGIFRDVYIISSPKTALWDYEIITDTEKAVVRAVLFEECKGAALRLTLDGEEVILNFDRKKAEYTFRRGARKLWNAETPNLYDLTFEVIHNGKTAEYHSKRIGFVKSSVENRRFLINGSPVIIHGINRHENNPYNGRYMTVEQIYNDLSVIKSANINAVRCSHYTNNPAFYEYASELGIYVMDEADLESHGCGITGDQGYLNKDPEWLDAFMDRVVRMTECNKNETCVVIWSVGNEIGQGENADKCIKYLRSREDLKPAVGGKPSSFIGCGYPNVKKLSRILEESSEDNRPICLIEYAHAMGNSPGSLEAIWNFVLDNPQFCGGYVWEFRNHGFQKSNPDGSIDYLYGGDFHDDNHWSNFTLDGYLTSDGTPKPTFSDLKYIYAPLRMFLDGNLLTIKNLRSFTDTSDMRFIAEFICDGKTVGRTEINVPVIPPDSSEAVELASPYPGYDRFITVRVMSGENIIALKQFILKPTGVKKPLEKYPLKSRVKHEKDYVSVSNEDFEIEFKNGMPCFYKKKGRIYFNEPMHFVTYRAEIDNDGIKGLFPRWIARWEDAGLHKMRFFTNDTTVLKNTDYVQIIANGRLTAAHCFTGFSITANYIVSHGGLLRVSFIVRPYGRMPVLSEYGSTGADDKITARLPRFGVCIPVSRDFNRVRWFGRGEQQNYTDATAAAPIGVYELPIEKLNFEFDVPQETGSRCDTRYVQLKNGTDTLAVYGSDTFSFAYHPWLLDTLRQARHKSELIKSEKNYLYIDYRMRALGSMSCGPNPEPEFDFAPHDFIFSFAINGEESKEPEFFLKDFGEKTRALTNEYVYVERVSERNEVECTGVPV